MSEYPATTAQKLNEALLRVAAYHKAWLAEIEAREAAESRLRAIRKLAKAAA